MPGERLSMRIREVLRLRFGQGLSQRVIGQSLRLSVGAVNAYLSRSRMAGLGWPLPAKFDDAQLETLRATRPGSRLVPPTRRLRLDPPQPAFGDQRSNRGRQVLAGLRAGTQGLPGRLLRAVSPGATAVCRTCRRAWRGQAATDAGDAGTHPAADHRRLGARTARRRAA